LNGAIFSPGCKIKQLDMHLTTFYGRNSIDTFTFIQVCRITNYKAYSGNSYRGERQWPPWILLDGPELGFLEVWNASDYNQPSDILFGVQISPHAELKILKWNAKNAFLIMAQADRYLSKLETYCGTDPSKVYFRTLKEGACVTFDVKSMFPNSTKIDIQEEIDDTDRTRV